MLVLVLTYHYNFNYTSSPAPNGQNEGSTGLISRRSKNPDSSLKSQTRSCHVCVQCPHPSEQISGPRSSPLCRYWPQVSPAMARTWSSDLKLTAARRWFIRAEIFCSSQLPAISFLVFSDQLCSDLDHSLVQKWSVATHTIYHGQL